MPQDQEFVEFVVKSIVDSPDEVKTDRTVDEMGVLVTLSVSPSDMGKIIGKEGRTAKALRTLLRVLGAKHNARVNLKIIEPDGGEVRVHDDHGDHADHDHGSHSQPAHDDQTENATEIL